MRSIALALLVMSVPLAAGAQDRGSVAQQNIDTHAYQDQFGQALRTNALEQQQDASRATQNPRRIRRAEEAARLINNGDCPGARDLALRANDTRLVARIDQVCNEAGTPAPATGVTVH